MTSQIYWIRHWERSLAIFVLRSPPCSGDALSSLRTMVQRNLASRHKGNGKHNGGTGGDRDAHRHWVIMVYACKIITFSTEQNAAQWWFCLKNKVEGEGKKKVALRAHAVCHHLVYNLEIYKTNYIHVYRVTHCLGVNAYIETGGDRERNV